MTKDERKKRGSYKGNNLKEDNVGAGNSIPSQTPNNTNQRSRVISQKIHTRFTLDLYCII